MRGSQGVGEGRGFTPLGAHVAAQVRGLVELLEGAVPEVVAARDAYDVARG